MRRSILSEDQAQLEQIEAKLAELAALSTAEQARKQSLINALQRGKTELLRSFGRLQRQRLLVA
jgi:hypothetical protein